MEMNHETVGSYLLSLPDTFLEYPFGEGVAVYKVGDAAKASEGTMFAIVTEKKEPVNLSLKCDPELSKVLREQYETVMPGYHLSKKHWNTLVLTGQLPWDEVQALIRHSYDLATA